MRPGDTPVPIPNTMVKTWAADGTMLETAWESRWLPDYLLRSSGVTGNWKDMYLENCILENTNIFITQKIQDIRDKNQEMFVNANET